MKSDDESPVARFIARDETPWTIFTRRYHDLDQSQVIQAPSSATMTVDSSPTAVFSSREPSIVTKPTSYGTSYPADDDNKEGKADITYAASLSATSGSGSEAEVEHDDSLRATLLGAGAWSSSHPAQGQLLRRHEHTKIRLSKDLPHRTKKPPVFIHQTSGRVASGRQDVEMPTAIPSEPIQKGMQQYAQPAVLECHRYPTPKCPFYLIPWQHYIVFGLAFLLVLTVLLSAKHLHLVDRSEAALRKRIVFVTTTLVALEVIVIALAARRTLSEASLLGLLPLGIGSMLLFHLDDLI